MTTPDIFISYSRDDQAVARQYADALKAEGFSVWWDTELRPGESFDAVIRDSASARRRAGERALVRSGVHGKAPWA